MATRTLVEVAALKAELEKTDYKDLKVKFIELGIESAWKNGVKKAAVIQLGLQALEIQELASIEVKEETVVKPTDNTGASLEEEESEDNEEEVLEDGEYELDEDAFVEYPQLIEMGFAVGDTLVVEAGKPWSKKEDEEDFQTKGPIDDSETVGIVGNLTTEEADKLIKGLNGGEEYNENLNEDDSDEDNEDEEEDEKIDSFEKTVSESGVVKIDESKFTLEEIQENIDITEGLIPQSIPSTRIILLHKLEALQAAHARKLSAE